MERVCLKTMAREPLARDLCICVCIYILLIAHQSTCFYLPGVAPEDFWKVIKFLVFLQNLFFLSILSLLYPFVIEFHVRSVMGLVDIMVSLSLLYLVGFGSLLDRLDSFSFDEGMSNLNSV